MQKLTDPNLLDDIAGRAGNPDLPPGQDYVLRTRAIIAGQQADLQRGVTNNGPR